MRFVIAAVILAVALPGHSRKTTSSQVRMQVARRLDVQVLHGQREDKSD